jgi:holin-like protein
MILALTVLLLCQLAGEAVVRAASLPVPGPVLGLAFLLGFLALRDRFSGAESGGDIEATGRGLLRHLSLLFVPAGVGVVQSLDVVAAHGIGLALALVVSTLAALVASVLTFRAVARWTDRGEGQP